jgi:hypothetical protein
VAAAGAEVLVRRAFALVVLALPLAACGGDVTSIDPVAQAAATSAKAHTMKVDIATRMSAPGLGAPIAVRASGDVDNDGHRIRTSIDMSSVEHLMPTGGDPADFRGEQIGDFSNGQAVVYMNLPFMTKLLPQQKPWIKLDLQAAAKTAGIDISQFTQFSSDPAQLLDYLRASGDVKEVGSETIDGVKTTHYRATIDFDRYPSLVPPARRAAVRRAVAALRRLTHVRLQPVDVWIGDDKLVRKLHEAFAETVQGQHLSLDLTMKFHDFNAPVSITIPAAADTADISQLTGGG